MTWEYEESVRRQSSIAAYVQCPRFCCCTVQSRVPILLPLPSLLPGQVPSQYLLQDLHIPQHSGPVCLQPTGLYLHGPPASPFEWHSQHSRKETSRSCEGWSGKDVWTHRQLVQAVGEQWMENGALKSE